MRKSLLAELIVLTGLASWTGAANAQSGQTAFGRGTTEPAIDLATGNTIFLLTPDKAPFPSKANEHAIAPLYLTAYPSTSTINPSLLNCQPHNCDHINVLPFLAPGYPNGGQACTQWGLPANGCSLLIGHDHLVGVPQTGDFNVAWNVVLVVFTPLGITHGASNHRALTLADVANLVMNHYAFEVVTPVFFNCSIVSSTVYYNGTPLSF